MAETNPTELDKKIRALLRCALAQGSLTQKEVSESLTKVLGRKISVNMFANWTAEGSANGIFRPISFQQSANSLRMTASDGSCFPTGCLPGSRLGSSSWSTVRFSSISKGKFKELYSPRYTGRKKDSDRFVQLERCSDRRERRRRSDLGRRSSMERAEHIGVKEAARFEGVNPGALLTKFRRKHMFLAGNPEDARKKLIPVSALSRSAYEAWVKGQTIAALQGMTGQAQVPSVSEQSIVPATESRGLLQRALVFAPPTETEQALDDAIPLAVPEDQRPYIERWAAILGDCTNGTWRKHRGECLEGLTIQHNGDFIRVQAKLYGIGVSTIHQKLGILKEINHNPEIPRERKMAEFWRRILPKTGQGAAGIHSLPKMTTYGWRRSSTTSI